MVYQESVSGQPLGPLADLWFERRGADGVPARGNFSPQEMRPWMGWIAIFQVIDRTPLRLQVRLHGTHLAAKTGYDLTGKILPDDVPSDCRPFIAGMALGLERALPVYEWIDAPGVLTYARLILPVASAGAVPGTGPDTLITSTDATDLRTGAPRDVSLTQAVGQVSDRMQRQVLTGPLDRLVSRLPQADPGGAGAGAP